MPTNPYQRLLYEHLEAEGVRLAPPARFRLRWLIRARHAVDVLHFHWPQPYYTFMHGPRTVRAALSTVRLVLFASRLLLARTLGYRTIWTIHQVDPHEREFPLIDRAAAYTLSRAAHVLVAHDRSTATGAEALLHLPAGRVEVVPHGSYVGVYGVRRPRELIREEHGISPNAFLFLSLGLLRAYKGIDVLLKAWESLEDDDALLVIAGMPLDEEVARHVREAAAADPRIKPILRYLSDDEVAELYSAADVAVVTRPDGGTSGALILALSMGVPVIAPNAPAYAELIGRHGGGWLYAPQSPEDLTRSLAAAAGDRMEAGARGAAALSTARTLDWSAVARRLAGLMSRETNPTSR